MAWACANSLCADCRPDFGGFHLRLRRQILALRIVHFLLRDQPGLGVRHGLQAVVLQVSNLVLRFHAVQLFAGVRHLFAHVLDGGLVLLQLGFQFGNFEDRHQLAFLDVRAIVHFQFLHVAGFLGVDVDFLERHQFGGQSQLALDGHADGASDSYGCGRGRFVHFGVTVAGTGGG